MKKYIIKVTFTPALQYNHYGASSVTIDSSYGTLDTSIAVGHISSKNKNYSWTWLWWGFRLLAYDL